ncbi:MAG: NitT/TauT family transport system substrate-binding protein [Frankiales bacterium]|nr:NitT/TauT family transport system substrate-binding protein [Frankiales bacterium]
MRLARTLRSLPAVLAVGSLVVTLSACGSDSNASAAPAGSGPPAVASELRLGYFANVTHASAVYGVGSGDFAKALGTTKLTPSVFNAGPAAIEALRGGAIDAAFLGPNPAVNGYTQTGGKLLRIVAGTTYGGASLVVQPDITDAAQLKGKKVATPQLGNTQDVAAKAFFKSRNVEPTIINQENAQTLDTFKAGSLDGAWVPEPWASRLVLDGGGKVLVDEASLWPEGKFVTTQLVVTQDFLKKYPGTVNALLTGLIAANDKVSTKSPEVQKVVNDQIKTDTGKALPDATLAAAFSHLTPSLDPIAASLQKGAKDAQAVGVTKQSADLAGIYDLRPLNALLKAAGKPTVTDVGLGVDGS